MIITLLLLLLLIIIIYHKQHTYNEDVHNNNPMDIMNHENVHSILHPLYAQLCIVPLYWA